MGLKEKRMIKMLNDEVIPSIRNELKEMSGVDIEWDVDWSGFKDMKSLMNIENQGLRRILDAFRNICYDEIGKEAIQEGVKKVVVKNFDDASEVKVTFENGQLEVYGAWSADWEGYPQESNIRSILEEGL